MTNNNQSHSPAQNNSNSNNQKISEHSNMSSPSTYFLLENDTHSQGEFSDTIQGSLYGQGKSPKNLTNLMQSLIDYKVCETATIDDFDKMHQFRSCIDQHFRSYSLKGSWSKVVTEDDHLEMLFEGANKVSYTISIAPFSTNGENMYQITLSTANKEKMRYLSAEQGYKRSQLINGDEGIRIIEASCNMLVSSGYEMGK
jgi:hypothetical protein